jgi:hypothetical protein
MASASPDFDGLRITLKSKEFPDAACPGDVACNFCEQGSYPFKPVARSSPLSLLTKEMFVLEFFNRPKNTSYINLDDVSPFRRVG